MPTGEHSINPDYRLFMQDPKISTWVSGLQKESIGGYSYQLFTICHGLGVSGSQLLEQAERDPKELSIKVKALIRNWDANGQKDKQGRIKRLKKRTLSYRISCMNNFLQANEVEPLPLAGLNLKSGHSKPHPLLLWDEAQRIISLADSKYQPIYRLMAWGMDAQRFVELNNDPEKIQKIKEQLKDITKPFIRVDFDRRHGNESPFYMLIPRALVEGLPVRTVNGQPEKHPTNIRANWRMALRSAGVPIDGEHGAHNLRAYWKTEATKRGLDEALRQHQLGHTVDPLNYQRIMQDEEWVTEQFRKAWQRPEVATKEQLNGVAGIAKELLNGQLQALERELAGLSVQIFINGPNGPIPLRTEAEREAEKGRLTEERDRLKAQLESLP